MASFSLFPKIESEEDRRRRENRRLTKPAQALVPLATQPDMDTSSEVNASHVDLEPASVSHSSIAARAPPTMQRQPSNPDLSSRARMRLPPASSKTTKAESPRLRAVASSPGLSSSGQFSSGLPPIPPIPPQVAVNRPSQKASVETLSPTGSSSYTASPISASTASSPISSCKHQSVSTTESTSSPATATSPQFAFSPSLIKSSSQYVVYPAIPTAQSPIIKSSPQKEALRRQSALGTLPPPPPFPSGTSLARSNTTATYRSASTVHTMRSTTTQSTARTTNAAPFHSPAKPIRAATAPAPRSIFPVFDPSRSLAEQQRSYYPAYNPTTASSRPLTMKNLQEAEHAFSAPPKRHGPYSTASGTTSASTARTLVGPSTASPVSPERKRPQQGPQPQHHLSEKQSMSGITGSTALVVFPPPRPSTSSGVPGNSSVNKVRNVEVPDAVQSGVSAALGACAFVIGVSVEVVGGAVGGLKRGVKKEREKKEKRDEKRAEKARKKAGVVEPMDGQERKSESSVRDGAESPGWVVGEFGEGEKRVVDFRI